MSGRLQVLEIEPEAPRPPGHGQPCNGCGLCCLAEPCPMGVVLSLRWRGRCRMLRWDAVQRRYVCGVLASCSTSARRGPRHWLRKAAARWIAAGAGCDAHLERIDPPPATSE